MGKMKALAIEQHNRIPALMESVEVRLQCKNCGHVRFMRMPAGVPAVQYTHYCLLCWPMTEEEKDEA